MPTPLYLDTARLGTLSPGARRLHLEFVRLAAEQPSTLYFERFLSDGFSGWPAEYQRCYPSLVRWHGIDALQRQLADLIAPGTAGHLHLASRSSALMRQAARLLCRSCRNICTTDLSWPAYQRILRREARRSGSAITTIHVRNSILYDRITPGELAGNIANELRSRRCDGLFLPVVDNLGIRLPIQAIVGAVRERADLRCVVGDAAQAFGHVSLTEAAIACDILIAGCHKWLGAYFPLGVGWFRDHRPMDVPRVSDPLARFVDAMSDGRLARHGETVNLAPLFACQGALGDLAATDSDAAFETQLDNADIVGRLADRTGSSTLHPQRAFRTGIVLLRHATISGVDSVSLREHLLEQGIVASVYDDGLVRLSMPRRALRLEEIARLRRALETTATMSRNSDVMIEHQNAVQTA